MSNSPIIKSFPLGFNWEVSNPFLFCVHHLDYYPKSNGNFGPDAPLTGRNIGQDFTPKDGWRMYHGTKVPGFPAHPHRGFETVTIVLQGFVDHSDSHGQAGRYGMGDVQWMTAGTGLQHSEMFPVLNNESENTLELFQVWLNLPKARKHAEPYFKMLWSEEIPIVSKRDENRKTTEIRIIAGQLDEVKAPEPAPDSWAADQNNEVAIWLIKMEAGAQWTLPAVTDQAVRNLYCYQGENIQVADRKIVKDQAFMLQADQDVLLKNSGAEPALFMLLQAKPINEPVAHYGPFVMNTEAELRQTFYDFQQTQFGGWPWDRHDQVHAKYAGRFAKYRDGKEVRPCEA